MTALPPLPQSDHIINTFDGTGILGMGQVDGYTAAQMQAYALAAIAKDRDRQSVPAFDSVRLTRFLTDVVTAAGLLSHGKQSKAVAERVAKEACAIRSMLAAPQPQPVQQLELTEYDAGLLNDFGGGNVEWWQDYIRAELGRAFEHYQSQVPAQGEKQ